jgi:hypothetical protein
MILTVLVNNFKKINIALTSYFLFLILISSAFELNAQIIGNPPINNSEPIIESLNIFQQEQDKINTHLDKYDQAIDILNGHLSKKDKEIQIAQMHILVAKEKEQKIIYFLSFLTAIGVFFGIYFLVKKIKSTKKHRTQFNKTTLTPSVSFLTKHPELKSFLIKEIKTSLSNHRDLKNSRTQIGVDFKTALLNQPIGRWVLGTASFSDERIIAKNICDDVLKTFPIKKRNLENEMLIFELAIQELRA